MHGGSLVRKWTAVGCLCSWDCRLCHKTNESSHVCKCRITQFIVWAFQKSKEASGARRRRVGVVEDNDCLSPGWPRVEDQTLVHVHKNCLHLYSEPPKLSILFLR